MQIISSKEFKNQDFTIEKLMKAEYENCKFIACQFNESHLSGLIFYECIFQDCDLSLCHVRNTSVKDIKFENCKLLGVRFEECNPFLLSLSFEGCNLSLSSFYKLSLKKTLFLNCNLKETDFTECNLNLASFDSSNLLGAIFKNTNLEKTDFRTAQNYAIDPEENLLKKTKFSKTGLEGLLQKYSLDLF
jgi:fluoroquinolone resistance protein